MYQGFSSNCRNFQLSEYYITFSGATDIPVLDFGYTHFSMNCNLPVNGQPSKKYILKIGDQLNRVTDHGSL